MAMYKLPIGIRVPDASECINGYDINEIEEKRNAANIIEGYKLRNAQEQKFTHFAEINIDSDKIWGLFETLSNNLIGNVAYGILGYKDEEPILSQFTEKRKIIDIFSKYKFELTNDGFL